MKVCKERSRFHEFLYFVRWQLFLVVLSLPYHVAFVVRGLAQHEPASGNAPGWPARSSGFT